MGDDESIIIRNKYLTAKSPVIWLLRDILGLSGDAITQIKEASKSILVSDENAELRDKVIVYVCGDSPVS